MFSAPLQIIETRGHHLKSWNIILLQAQYIAGMMFRSHQEGSPCAPSLFLWLSPPSWICLTFLWLYPCLCILEPCNPCTELKVCQVWSHARTVMKMHLVMTKKRSGRNITYLVPLQLLVHVRVWSSPKSLDKPKSAIFGTILPSSIMFAGFRSMWIIGVSCHSSWR